MVSAGSFTAATPAAMRTWAATVRSAAVLRSSAATRTSAAFWMSLLSAIFGPLFALTEVDLLNCLFYALKLMDRPVRKRAIWRRQVFVDLFSGSLEFLKYAAERTGDGVERVVQHEKSDHNNDKQRVHIVPRWLKCDCAVLARLVLKSER